MKPTPILLALLALVAGLVIAGCGDDDEDEPQTLTSGATGATGADGDAPTSAAFIKSADEICAEGNTALETEGTELFGDQEPSDAEATEFVEDIVIPNIQEQHDAIAELTPPEGEEEALEDLVTQLQAGIDELAADPEGFVNSGGENSTLFEAANTAAKELGLKVCGEG